MQVKTGFHAIEEYLRSLQAKNAAEKNGNRETEIRYAKAGPRIKRIIELACTLNIRTVQTGNADLDFLVRDLNETSRDHRGIVLITGREEKKSGRVDFDTYLAQLCSACAKEKRGALAVMLDSLTDPHNVGAIMRSCDQLGADLLILPERHGAKDSAVIERASAGASAWLPTAVVPNLVRAVEKLQEAGFWVYGAAADGISAHSLDLSGKIALVMGSEGSGIGRLLATKCDGFISVPCCGKLDSLNVSVAAGILLYERRRQCLTKIY